jgi:hypothetical protein
VEPMSDNEEWTDIGHGVSILFYVQGDEPAPAGLLERHLCLTDDEHAGLVPFNPVPDHPEWPTWTVESWTPLTISPSVLCRTCGRHGWIREGAWVSA